MPRNAGDAKGVLRLARGQERSLRNWLVEEYRPEHFKTWLEARGMGDAFRTIQQLPASARRSA